MKIHPVHSGFEDETSATLEVQREQLTSTLVLAPSASLRAQNLTTGIHDTNANACLLFIAGVGLLTIWVIGSDLCGAA